MIHPSFDTVPRNFSEQKNFPKVVMIFFGGSNKDNHKIWLRNCSNIYALHVVMGHKIPFITVPNNVEINLNLWNRTIYFGWQYSKKVSIHGSLRQELYLKSKEEKDWNEDDRQAQVMRCHISNNLQIKYRNWTILKVFVIQRMELWSSECYVLFILTGN